MKYLILFFFSSLFCFEVEFYDVQNIDIFPLKKVILLKTNKPIFLNYNHIIRTKKGVLLLNYEKADEFVRNDLYFNGEIQDIKIGILDIDKIRNQIIIRLNKYYKNCEIKKIIFLGNYKKIYFKPTFLKIKSKVILDCN